MGLESIAGVFFGFVPDELVGVVDALLFGVEVSEPLEGIDGNNDITGTGVWSSLLVAFFEVKEDTGLRDKNE